MVDWAIGLMGCGLGMVILGFFLPPIARGPDANPRGADSRVPIDQFIVAQSGQIIRLGPKLRRFGVVAILLGGIVVVLSKLVT